jgi:hypothetical protein
VKKKGSDGPGIRGCWGPRRHRGERNHKKKTGSNNEVRAKRNIVGVCGLIPNAWAQRILAESRQHAPRDSWSHPKPLNQKRGS